MKTRINFPLFWTPAVSSILRLFYTGAGIATLALSSANAEQWTLTGGPSGWSTGTWTEAVGNVDVPAFSPPGVPGGTYSDIRLHINGEVTYSAADGIQSYDNSALGGEDRPLLLGAGINSGTQTLNLTGGTLRLIQQGVAASLIGAGTNNSNTGVATVNVSGGLLDASLPAFNGEIGVLARGTGTASGILTIGGTGTVVADIVSFGTLAAVPSATATATINLNSGGTLISRAILDRNAVANSTINFDGGTLKATATGNAEDWIRSGAGGITVNLLAGGAIFDTNGQNDQRISVGMAGAGGFTKTGAGTLVLLSNTNTYDGDTLINEGTLKIGNGGVLGTLSSGTGALSMATGTTLAFSRSDALVQSSLAHISDGYGGDTNFAQMGPGLFTMDVANSFTGTTSVTGGVLEIATVSALASSSAISATGAGTLQIDGGIDFSQNITISGAGEGGSRGALRGGADGVGNVFSGDVTVTSDSTRIGTEDNGNLTVTGGITDGGNGHSLIFRPGLDGTLTLVGTSSWTGDTDFFGDGSGTGKLVLGSANVLPLSTVLGAGPGIIDLNGFDHTLGGLADFVGSGTIITNGAGGSTLTLDVADASAQNANVALADGSNPLTLVKTGSGGQTLGGISTHSGTTTVSAGSLIVNGEFTASNVTVETGGTLGGTGTLGGAVDVAGTIAPGISAGTLNLANTTISGTYACEIDGAVSDVLAITGDLTLTGSSSITAAILEGGATESEYVIATYTGNRSGTFASVPSGYTVTYDDGLKQVRLTVPEGNAYDAFVIANGIPGALPGDDADNDGIPNGIEFVIGGVPSGPDSDSNPLLIAPVTDATYLIHQFRRTADSAPFDPYVEYGSDLVGWTKAVDGQDGVVIEVAEGTPDLVTVKIPKALAGGAKLFSRLAVEIP